LHDAPNALLPRESAPIDPRTRELPPRGSSAIPGELTIGIDARAAVEVPAGRGRVVRELLRALAGREDDGVRYVLYARAPWREHALDERFRWCAMQAREPWWHLRAARCANRECDAFLATNSYLTARFLRIPCVPIVHDLVTFDRAMRPNRRSRVIEQLTLGPAVRRAAALIVTTRVTAEILAQRCPRAAQRIIVAPLGVAPEFTLFAPGDAPRETAASALPPPGFVLAAGTLEPRKNLPRLVEAYRQLPEALRERHPLVVVGALGWETGATLDALDSLGGQAIRLGYVSDATLAELYRRCAVFCYPSLGEGFGLPVLEAMAAGAAVLTSNLSSLPEVGGDAVAYADPYDVASIAAGLRRVLEDEVQRAELGRRGRERAADFSWPRFAGNVIETLTHAASDGRRSAAAAAGAPLTRA
jgi:glycosyltransferase involved in cell wall biosynthesis